MPVQNFRFQTEVAFPFVRGGNLWGIVLRGWLLEGMLTSSMRFGVPLKDGTAVSSIGVQVALVGVEPTSESRVVGRIATTEIAPVYTDILVQLAASQMFAADDVDITKIIAGTSFDGT